MQYLGGKFRIAKLLAPIIAKELESKSVYWEPFIGGFYVGCAVAPLVKPEVQLFASDIHPDLVMLYQHVKTQGMEGIPATLSEELYQTLKKAPSSALRGFVGFGCSFGGKWFGGYARSKKNQDYVGGSWRALAKQARYIQRFNVWECDFVTSPETQAQIFRSGLGVIYCDPPYLGTTGYSNKFDFEGFYNKCRELASWGNTVLVSEYEIKQPKFDIVWEQASQKAMHTSKQSRLTKERLYYVRS